MEEVKNPVASQTINRPHVQTIRQLSPLAPFYFDFTMLPAIVSPSGRELVMKNTEYDPNKFNPNSKKLVRTAFIILAVKSILFAAPPLIIGVIYLSQCQVQEWIPRFLMVLGIETIVENLLLSIALLIVMIVLRRRSELARHKTLELVRNIVSWIGIGCTLAWFIAGSVWTFSVKNQVEFDDFQKSNYCHPAPYWCAFVLCVLWYSYLFLAILCIPCIWKCQKNLIEDQNKFNPVQYSVTY